MGEYEIQAGDYISFHRIVQRRGEPCTTGAVGTDIELVMHRSTDRCIKAISGAGYVVSIAKEPQEFYDVDGRRWKVQTATVDAGQLLGKVTAVLTDDAILVAKQQSFGMDSLLAPAESSSMYGTDAKGHQ